MGNICSRNGEQPVAAQTEQETSITFLRKLASDRRGATAIEYGLIAALIAVAAVGAMSTLGSNLQNTFTNVSNNMNAH